MAPADKSPAAIKWNTRQRFQYIELMAFYTGVVSRSDIARTFGISDAAATKDLKRSCACTLCMALQFIKYLLKCTV